MTICFRKPRALRFGGLLAGLSVSLLALPLFTTAGQAASFDCAAATSANEKAICETRSLNDQDVRMATLYEVLSHLVGMGRRSALQDEQREWLKTRDACAGDVACLNAAYVHRISALEQGLKEIYTRGPY